MSLLLLFTPSPPTSIGFADIVAHLVDISDLSTSVRELEATRGREWQELLSAPGAAKIVFQNDDADLAFINNQSLIRFDTDSLPRFVMVCEEYDRSSITQDEEAGEATTWSGRGHLALLERGLVYPSQGPGSLPIEDDRPFNWTSPVYDDSLWDPVNVIMSVASAKTSWIVPFSDDFPDNTASVIWGTGNASSAPIGCCFFRKTVTAPTTGRYLMFLLIDDYGDLYVDGQLEARIPQGDLGDISGFAKATQLAVDLTAGTHEFAIRGCNAGVLGPGNPGGVAFALYKSNQRNELGALVDHTSSSWKVNSYPPNPPGMTAGLILRLCVEEFQARGVLTDLTLNFSDTTDSEGNTWPELIDISTAVGTDSLSFFRELAEAFVDLWMDPSALQLSAWIFNGRGVVQPVTYEAPTNPNDPMTGNLTVLTHRGKT